MSTSRSQLSLVIMAVPDRKKPTMKRARASRKRKGKREYLNDVETGRMMKELNEYFEYKVNVPLIRHGKRQRIETLINEETLLLARFLRDERKTWILRLGVSCSS